MSEHFLTATRKNTVNSDIIAYLTETRMPFLQVVGMVSDDYVAKLKGTMYARIESGGYGEPSIIDIGSWALQYWPKLEDYPPAICVSSSNVLIGGAKQESLNKYSSGTIQGQAFDVAAQIVLFAINLQWDGIQIVDGSKHMQWATWAVAGHNKLPCYGFSETTDDTDKADRIAEILAAKYTKDAAPDITASLAPSKTKAVHAAPKDKDKG